MPSIQFAESTPIGGSFYWTSSSHSGPVGSQGEIVTAFIKNTGTVTITGISYSCSGGSWTDFFGPTSLAPGVTAGWECQAQAPSYSAVFRLTGTNAINSPFSTPNSDCDCGGSAGTASGGNEAKRRVGGAGESSGPGS